jgi:hypothetical protein
MDKLIIRKIIKEYLKEHLELETKYWDNNTVEIQLILDGEKISSVEIDLE